MTRHPYLRIVVHLHDGTTVKLPQPRVHRPGTPGTLTGTGWVKRPGDQILVYVPGGPA